MLLILGHSNLASSFLSVLPKEVKEKEKYVRNGQQSFDILLACLCIMKYWICGSCCAYHSSGGGIWNEKCPKYCVFLTFPLLRCTSFVRWLSSPCLFSGPRCPPTGFDLFPLLIICCLILDINNQSSYSLIFFAPSKGSTPSLFLFFFPLLIWASQVMMMIMVFIFNLSVSRLWIDF